MILLKNGTMDGYTYTNHVIARVFRKIFLSSIGENQTKSYHLSTEPLGLCHVVNPALVIALRL